MLAGGYERIMVSVSESWLVVVILMLIGVNHSAAAFKRLQLFKPVTEVEYFIYLQLLNPLVEEDIHFFSFR
jgi:hypothetical protein